MKSNFDKFFEVKFSNYEKRKNVNWGRKEFIGVTSRPLSKLKLA